MEMNMDVYRILNSVLILLTVINIGLIYSAPWAKRYISPDILPLDSKSRRLYSCHYS